MDDLPTASDAGNKPISTNTPNPPAGGSISPALPAGGQIGVGLSGKELEPAAGGLEQSALKDVSGKEIELPKEVAAAGVTTQPTTVQLPQSVMQMGVKPVGQAVMPQATTVVLPLTDDQIVQGLKQSITSSWRWLAEWCVRRLKQLHIGIQKTGGRLLHGS